MESPTYDSQNESFQLPEPPVYFPLEKGVYEVAPGLHPLGRDFGNGRLDQNVFQFDRNFFGYYKNKVAGRAERLSKYVLRHDLAGETEKAAVQFLLARLPQEWPELFVAEVGRLSCRLTGVVIEYSEDLALKDGAYESLMDALIAQIPEDFAIISRNGESNWISYLNIFSPSHWSPEEKIGKSFDQVHAPVPGYEEKMQKFSAALVDGMIKRGPFGRFVWSVVTDERLNHHHEPPPGWDPIEWKGRQPDFSKTPPFDLRIERQVTWGLPTVDAGLFFIRVHFISGNVIKANPHYRERLLSTIKSVSPSSRWYKGVERKHDEIVAWLSD